MQVSWKEIHDLLDWVLHNIRLVDIQTGGKQSFYVDLSLHVYSSLRVPFLALQSPRCVCAPTCVSGMLCHLHCDCCHPHLFLLSLTGAHTPNMSVRRPVLLNLGLPASTKQMEMPKWVKMGRQEEEVMVQQGVRYELTILHKNVHKYVLCEANCSTARPA